MSRRKKVKITRLDAEDVMSVPIATMVIIHEKLDELKQNLSELNNVLIGDLTDKEKRWILEVYQVDSLGAYANKLLGYINDCIDEIMLSFDKGIAPRLNRLLGMTQETDDYEEEYSDEDEELEDLIELHKSRLDDDDDEYH